MIKADAAVKRETEYIAYFCVLLSVIMQAGFVFLKRWDYTFFLGNLLSLTAAVLNFYFMGITIQKAVNMNEQNAKKLMRASQRLRKACMFAAIVIGVIMPCFNTLAVIIPVFFPRLAVAFRPLLKNQKEVTTQ